MKMTRVFLVLGMFLCMAGTSFSMASPLRDKPQVEFVIPTMLVASDLYRVEAQPIVYHVVADVAPINEYTAVGFVATVKYELRTWAPLQSRWHSCKASEQGFKLQLYENSSLNHPRIRYLS